MSMCVLFFFYSSCSLVWVLLTMDSLSGVIVLGLRAKIVWEITTCIRSDLLFLATLCREDTSDRELWGFDGVKFMTASWQARVFAECISSALNLSPAIKKQVDEDEMYHINGPTWWQYCSVALPKMTLTENRSRGAEFCPGPTDHLLPSWPSVGQPLLHPRTKLMPWTSQRDNLISVLRR